MAGDFDITPVKPASAVDAGLELEVKTALSDRKAPAETKKVAEEDATEKHREALASALSERQFGPEGKLVIERDQDTGKFVQKVIDPDSGEVLRQWPEEKFLELAKQMGEAYGLMVDQQI
ncbi:flagellar protein FlaG [Ponticaulis sp.]|uniref:flagellar protein FlaG n=1 Tax=Ponticaulis sp. TaxID=2020902 RepID=UPI000B74D3AB|nr:flagellar protein FlaG [Ponticaulis sp.]MAI90534.1 hypothetical protein [Ponticaulis sp.]OUY00225.1 MAG: hypothetical protein CBB65_08855 [Hyphomonadaceae bacterium TMED5]|tara:strand:+ start:161771 stop:162130 length:360 start_codon:yes stop_codon:yes gene_type:complete